MPQSMPVDDAELSSFANYLNLEEMRTFCARHRLPLSIHVEGPDGRLLRSKDRDRKDVVVRRILDFAMRGERTGPTVYVRHVAARGPLPERLTARTRVHYGQYEKKNPAFVDILERLSGGAFRTGMIARLVLRDFWTAGEVPTLQQFAEAWLDANAAHTSPRPEGAYLLDLHHGTATEDWKALRVQRARAALEELERRIAQRG